MRNIIVCLEAFNLLVFVMLLHLYASHMLMDNIIERQSKTNALSLLWNPAGLLWEPTLGINYRWNQEWRLFLLFNPRISNEFSFYSGVYESKLTVKCNILEIRAQRILLYNKSNNINSIKTERFHINIIINMLFNLIKILIILDVIINLLIQLITLFFNALIPIWNYCRVGWARVQVEKLGPKLEKL